MLRSWWCSKVPLSSGIHSWCGSRTCHQRSTGDTCEYNVPCELRGVTAVTALHLFGLSVVLVHACVPLV